MKEMPGPRIDSYAVLAYEWILFEENIQMLGSELLKLKLNNINHVITAVKQIPTPLSVADQPSDVIISGFLVQGWDERLNVPVKNSVRLEPAYEENASDSSYFTVLPWRPLNKKLAESLSILMPRMGHKDSQGIAFMSEHWSLV